MVKTWVRGSVGVILTILLTAVFFPEFVQPLQCFSCQEPTTPEKCMRVTNCTQNHTMCKTTMHSREEVYPFVGEATVTRSCSVNCNLLEVDEIGSVRPVTCCNTNLCNHDGASWLDISCTMLGGIVASVFLFLR